MSINLKKTQRSLKVIRRFNEDIWGRLALIKKPLRVLDHLYEVYQNNFKYNKLLKSNKKSFFLLKKRKPFLYKVTSEDKEFRRRKRTLKINNYLMRLKLRRFYGNLREKKFKKIFNQASLNSNVIGRSFVYFLESRLDVILYRANFFTTIYGARQYINHKKVYVNGSLVNKPGFKLSVNDIVTLKDADKFYNNIKYKLLNNDLLVNYPSYLEVNYKLASVSLIKLPDAQDVPFPFFMNLKNIVHNFLK